ncbi:TPA: 5-amino-6-(5-phospho-D-ribitylamino)uracil phosphatase YigB [Morganella morganii]
MRFYRPLSPVRAMTFDLDDTLYDNRPVMDKTEEEVIAFIRQYDPRFSELPADYINVFRDRIRRQQPEIFHDVSRWRLLSWRTFFLHYGYTAARAQAGADAVMAHFAQWRSRIDVPQSTHDTLTALAAKIPLVAITNGNMEPEKCGLADYFTFILKAGPDGRAKPFCDMYRTAAQRLALPAENILHVGDNLNTDVEGALCSGMQACWLNLDGRDVYHDPETRLLPHIEITQLDSLTGLL